MLFSLFENVFFIITELFCQKQKLLYSHSNILISLIRIPLMGSTSLGGGLGKGGGGISQKLYENEKNRHFWVKKVGAHAETREFLG